MARRDALALLLLASALWKGVAWIRPLAAGPLRVVVFQGQSSCACPGKSLVVRCQAPEDWDDGTSPSAIALRVGRGAMDWRGLGR
jgi:hypothetical protein